MALVHNLVGFALKIGILERPNSCEECGRTRYVVAHHDDYSDPLEVRWLCRPCHGNWHSKNGPGLNRDFAGFDVLRTRLPSQFSLAIEKMRKLRTEGWTLQRIGDKYGFTREYARQIVGDIKVINPSKTEAIKEKMEDIALLRNEGKTLSEIAKALGLSRGMMSVLKVPPRKEIIRHGIISTYDYRGCRCSACRESNSQRTKKLFNFRRENGLCVSCMTPSHTWYCKKCTQRRRERRSNA